GADDVVQRHRQIIVGRPAAVVDHLDDQRAGIDHDINQHEKSGQQQHRTQPVRCDVRVKTVCGHDGCPTRPCRLQNFTVGTCSTSARLAPRSKKSLRVKPNIPANRAAGICWMPVLYSWTALLKKRRLAAILFSRSESSLASCWKLALALRSG